MNRVVLIKKFFEEFDLEFSKKINERTSVIPLERKLFGEKIRELRKKTGLKRDEAAKAIGKKSPHIIVYYESGRNLPPKEYIEFLCKRACLSPDETVKLFEDFEKIKKTRYRRVYQRVIQERKQFGENLRKLREKAGLTRSEVAHIAEAVTPMKRSSFYSAIWKYEKGIQCPPDWYVRLLCEKACISKAEEEKLIEELALLRYFRGNGSKKVDCEASNKTDKTLPNRESEDKNHRVSQICFHISPKEDEVVRNAVIRSDVFVSTFDFLRTVKECFKNSLERVLNLENSTKNQNEKLEEEQTYSSPPEWFVKDFFNHYGKNLQGGRRHVRLLRFDADKHILHHFRDKMECRPGELFRICMLYAAEKVLRTEKGTSTIKG